MRRQIIATVILAGCVASHPAWAQKTSSGTTQVAPPTTATAPASTPGAAQENTALDQAEAAIETQDYAKAQTLATQAVTANPKDVRALYDLGFAEQSLGHADAAEANYRKALEIQPSLPQVQLALGRLLANQNKNEEARKQFVAVTQEAAAGGSLQGEAWRALATMDLADNVPAARDDLLHALQISPTTPEDTLLTGRLAELSDDPQTAEQAYRNLLAAKKLVPEASAALGRLLLKQHRYADAEAVLQTALAISPDNPVLQAQMGTALANDGKGPEALVVLEKAYKAQPANAALGALLADVANQSGDPTEAAEIYVTLLKNDPQNAEMLASYGASLIRQQRYAEAEKPLEAAVKIKPNLGDAWASLAFANSRTEDYQAVLDDLTQRKKYLPENASSYFLWGLAYDKLRRYKEALENYQLFLAAAGGKFPDQEFQVRHRVVVLKQK